MCALFVKSTSLAVLNLEDNFLTSGWGSSTLAALQNAGDKLALVHLEIKGNGISELIKSQIDITVRTNAAEASRRLKEERAARKSTKPRQTSKRRSTMPGSKERSTSRERRSASRERRKGSSERRHSRRSSSKGDNLGASQDLGRQGSKMLDGEDASPQCKRPSVVTG